MKISVNWIKEFTDIKLTSEELVSRIGSQLGEVEEVVDLSEKYKDVLVVKVVSCEKHPNADKLSVCLIDDGKKAKNVKRDKDGFVQVVCGAPNVRGGLTVAWLPPGSVVPSTYSKEQFKLEVRPLRGIDSNGMLASPKELEISDSHEGILVVDKPAKPGQKFADVYDLNDTIVTIENKMFTHRPDCFGILGVAREIAGIQNIKFKSPKWYINPINIKSTSNKLTLKIANNLPSLVPRFVASVVSGVKVRPSPIIMQSYLSRLGLKPINNIVDITNFVMLLTAQPLHAYDYDKLCSIDKSKSASIVVRKPKKGEKIKLLSGKIIIPQADTIMIASKHKLIGVGGVMGGSETEVDPQTKNIILECASFDMYSIRRASMANGLFTDAVTRFNKGQSPHQNKRVANYALAMILKLAGGDVTGRQIDEKGKIKPNRQVSVDTSFINSRLGLDLTTSEIVRLLTNVEFDINREKTSLKVRAPFWRTDIEIPEDIVEEVGRLYGYDHLPLELPKRSVEPSEQNKILSLKSNVRQILASAGANELITYNFVRSELIEAAGQSKARAYRISNALSPDLQFYRLSIMPNLLEKVHPNIKAGYEKFAIFEIGKSHTKEHVDTKTKLPAELDSISLVWASKTPASGAAYFQAKKYLEVLTDKLGVAISFKPLVKKSTFDIDQPFDIERSAYIVNYESGTVLGIVGEYTNTVSSKLKLPSSAAGFEIWTDKLLETIPEKSPYHPLSKFPSTHQDISLEVKNNCNYEQVYDCVRFAVDTVAEHSGYDYSISPQDIYRPKDPNYVRYSFKISLSHKDRTLVTEEVNKLLDLVSEEANKKLGAKRL